MAATAPVELGQAEGRLQLAQITALLAGVYDNDPQRFYLEGMKRGKTAPPRLHLEIRKSAQLPNASISKSVTAASTPRSCAQGCSRWKMMPRHGK